MLEVQPIIGFVAIVLAVVLTWYLVGAKVRVEILPVAMRVEELIKQAAENCFLVRPTPAIPIG